MCNLRCVFCQNWDISQPKRQQQQGKLRRPRQKGEFGPGGWELSGEEIADLMLKIQEEGCHNINLVTPEHVVPQAIEALAIAWEKGLVLPIVYNTSSYDSERSLELLDGLVDVYMPDFKFWDRNTALRLAKAADYPDTAKRAIKEMQRQVGDLKFDENGLAKQGVLIPHLVMPGLANEAKQIMHWISEQVSHDAYVDLMEQYRSTFMVGNVEEKCFNRAEGKYTTYEDLNRSVSLSEVEEVRNLAESVGLWRFYDLHGFESLSK